MGANMKPIPICCTQALTCCGCKSSFTPSASSTSALPHLLDTERLPCLAIFTPALAATSAAGVDTLKVLEPLTNPAGARRQVLGVFSDDWLEPLAQVLQTLASEHVMVVHAQDGLDEFSIAAVSNVCELHAGRITRYQVSPEDVGLTRASLDLIKVHDVQDSVALIQALLAGEQGAAADIVAFNAGAAIYVAGLANSVAHGVELASQQLASGAAADKLTQLIVFTQQQA